MIVLLLALIAAPAERSTIGVWGRWAAFRDANPARCFAISAPLATGGRARAFASVAAGFGRDRRAALYVRLSARRNLAAPITLAIGERRFALSGNDDAAWAPDAATDRAIVAALRGARGMSVAAVTPAGTPYADSYALAGAATAIDAAMLACR